MTLPNKEDVIITHYGCSDFTNEMHTVFWLGAIYFENGNKTYFFVSGNEEENIKEYFNFLKNNKHKQILHWSMNTPQFGFTALRSRYQELTAQKIEINFINKIDLSEFLKEKYGINYIARDKGRLNNLATLNGFSGYSDKIEISSKNDAVNRLELFFSIYQAEQQGCLKVNFNQNKKYASTPLFSTNIVDEVIDILKQHFGENQHLALKELLKNGKTPTNKLYFMNNGNKLLDVFKQLIEKNLITNCSKAELEKWIYNHFEFRNRTTKKIQNYKPKTINDTISNINAKPTCKNPLLTIDNGIITKI